MYRSSVELWSVRYDGQSQTYDLLKFALARPNGSSFLLITQYEMPFINKREATKRPKRTEK